MKFSFRYNDYDNINEDNDYLYRQTPHFFNNETEPNYHYFNYYDNNNYSNQRKLKGKSERKKIQQPNSTRGNQKILFDKNDSEKNTNNNNNYNNHIKTKNNIRRNSQRLSTAPNTTRNKTPIKKKKSLKNDKDNLNNIDTHQKVESELNNLMNLIPDEFYNDPVIKNKFQLIMKNIDDIKQVVNKKSKKKNLHKDNFVKINLREKNHKKNVLNQPKKNN